MRVLHAIKRRLTRARLPLVSPSASRATVRAAGCIVWSTGSREPEVLLVHRPRWEDWSFPKGKLEPGEAPYDGRGPRGRGGDGSPGPARASLPDTHYTCRGGQPKVVHYWCAEARKYDDISDYPRTTRSTTCAGSRRARRCRRLSYPYDSDLLETFLTRPFDTKPLLVVRHAHARHRKTWKGEDAERPLRAEGKEEAHKLVDLFAAYGVDRVVISSDAVRCVDTVLPISTRTRRSSGSTRACPRTRST